MANKVGNVSLKITGIAYDELKKHCDDRFYTYGGFASRAIMTAISKEKKNETRKPRAINKIKKQ